MEINIYEKTNYYWSDAEIIIASSFTSKSFIALQDYHIDEEMILKDINNITEGETTYGEIETEIENRFVYYFNQEISQEFSSSVRVSEDNFVFNWDLNGIEEYDAFYLSDNEMELNIVADPDYPDNIVSGSDKYHFIITEDNLSKQKPEGMSIFILFGMLIGLIVFFGFALLIIKSLFNSGGNNE